MCTQDRDMFGEADALRWSLQIALALEYLHTREPKVSMVVGITPGLHCQALLDSSWGRQASNSHTITGVRVSLRG